MIANFSDDFDEAPSVQLRDYQDDCLRAIAEAWRFYSRALITMATGCGKTVLFSRETLREVRSGGRVLILAHTDELLEQAIDKLRKTTGLIAEKEKADSIASPAAKVVVASIQTLSRENRLRGFRDDHFTLVICDEAHRALAKSYQRVMCYFHFGAESLEPSWTMPLPESAYSRHAKVLGVTATADRGDKRSLGEFFQKCVFEYGLLEAVRDGYLVKPIVKNIPIKIDVRGVKTSKLSGQADFDVSEVAQRLSPLLAAIAVEIRKEAWNRKTVVFTPSIETAKMLAKDLQDLGVTADFVTGACDDRSEKIAAFDRGANGRVIICAMLLTEGWDCPTASCVCVLRPTKIRALFTQAVGRCTRTLPGVIDGLQTPEERLAAIAASDKPDMLILDFLWLADRLDLVRPVDLVLQNAEAKEFVDSAEPDLIKAAKAGERDLLASLEKATKKNSRKKARTMDPLAWAVTIGDKAIANYVPQSRMEEMPANEAQLELLRRNGMTIDGTICRGLADLMIDRIMSRVRLKLCSPAQMMLLLQFGISEEEAALTSSKAAGAIIGRKFSR